MSGQNTSTAVMARRVEPPDSLDYFPTPPWATRALCEVLNARGYDLSASSVREPAAGEGHMSNALAEYFGHVEAADVHDYGVGLPVRDYLFALEGGPPPIDWTITNPPFRLAQDFIEQAIATSDIGCAFLVRTSFLEGIARGEELFAKHPASLVLQFQERVPMVRGRLDQEASSATAYAWLVWLSGGANITELQHIKASRKRLERDSDYPPLSEMSKPSDMPLFGGEMEAVHNG